MVRTCVVTDSVTRVIGDENDRDRKERIGEAGTEGAGNRHGQQYRGKSIEDVGHAHDRHVRASARETGNEAERAADEQRRRNRQHAHHERKPSAVDEPREHVAAKLVCPEDVIRRADRKQPLRDVRERRIVESQPRRKNGGGCNQQQHGGADHGI